MTLPHLLAHHCKRTILRTCFPAAVLCLAGTIPSLIHPMPASAELRFRADSLHAPVWKRLYDRMAAVWKADRPVEVREVSDREMDRIVERTEGRRGQRDDSIVDGCYNGDGEEETSPGHITLRASLRGADAEMVFTHEYGHYVWDEILSDTDRSGYRRLWREQRHADHLVTSYAAEDVEEGFAEAFAYYLRKPETLRRRDSRSWAFLNDVQRDRELAENP